MNKEELDALWEKSKKKKFTILGSLMSELYGAGPLPVGLEKNKFRIKKLIQKSLNKGEIENGC